MDTSLFGRLEQTQTSYLLLAILAGTLAAAAILYQVGIMGWVLRGVGQVVRGVIGEGFLLWERSLAWASWQEFLVVVCGLFLLGGLAGGRLPGLRVVCGLATLGIGAVACLAYMCIDLERNEVERGHKAVHNPLKGQMLARNLERYGKQVGIPLLIAAAVSLIGGFAFLNQGLYETIGQNWYQIADLHRRPIYVDFLAYALTKILGLIDVLDLARSHHILGTAFVRPAAWPASALLAGFKVFFTFVLLHQIFASLRQGKLLAETIADFWSPHEPIHDRACGALPIYGTVAIGPFLGSLRLVPSLTKEQRTEIPLILETIGPSIIPALVRHLRDQDDDVRAIAAAALGHLHALETVPVLAELANDPSDVVRQSVVAALGSLGCPSTGSGRNHRGLGRKRGFLGRAIWRSVWWKKRPAPKPPADPIELAVATLEFALADPSAAVRAEAALALGRIGPDAAAAAPRLIDLFQEGDEMVRCQAAQALGEIGEVDGATAAALVGLLGDASATVRVSAAQALGALRKAAAPWVTALVPLLQDRDESVRKAAALAISQVGTLDHAATDHLTLGLGSRDNVVRAQTAEALGTIGAAAEQAAPALVQATTDGNDRVRAKAVEALGKIGEPAAAIAVPGLVRALVDRDNWVSALAAEALGEMGNLADGAIPALVRSLSHPNAEVRRNSAEALGKMNGVAAAARPSLEKSARDLDGGVRSQAIRALGAIGSPTPTSTQVVLAGLQDLDPQVRAAAIESVGQWGEASTAVVSTMFLLLEDANDQVKVQVTKVLPRLAGATPEVIDGLCRRLLEDDSDWVQLYAALALGKLGHAAAAAGASLLRAAQTGEVSVREQAMRAIAMIQPPETTEALAAGLNDVCGDIRRVASAGWMNAAAISEEAIPALIEGLRDPEVQVRANCAHALARLDVIPAAAIPLLIECTADANEGLRMSAARALKLAPAESVVDVMQHLLVDPNSRVRLIAASSLLVAEPGNILAGAVLAESLEDPVLRVQEAALILLDSLGEGGIALLEELKETNRQNQDAEFAVISRRTSRTPSAVWETVGSVDETPTDSQVGDRRHGPASAIAR
jgi:HEAT repeat protein